ncbi:MAG: nucleotidyl transferase AbiEii/AbiGii toxin family protein [Deltaproteobacteria bacterium]|nr:nucleotidyl transferase AbiEii/AbiGii toxin family protein [Deltaproteobacteria bacterium]
MADESVDGRSSRPPTIDDLVELCGNLNEAGARYVLIGGFAMAYHGMPRMTEDIDLLIDPAPENVRRIRDALSYLPDNAAKDVGDRDVADYTVVRVADEIVVDLLKQACGVEYKDAVVSIEIVKLKGVSIPVAGIDTMIRTKQGVRARDREDLAFLLSLKGRA